MATDLLNAFLKPISVQGGQRECGGALSNEAPLRTPGKRACMHPPWVPVRAAGRTLRFSSRLFGVQFLASGTPGQNLTPTDHQF